MNIQGIKTLRQLGLPGPNNETIFKNLSELDLDWIYQGTDKGLAIMAFDSSKPIDMNVFNEIKARKYKVQREQIQNVVGDLSDKLKTMGVSEKDILFLANQMYVPETIEFCGKAVVYVKDGIGRFHLDAVKSLRKDSQEFSRDFSYSCPVVDSKSFRSKQDVTVCHMSFPIECIVKILEETKPFAGKSFCIDFEKYAGGLGAKGLFYHDFSIINRN